MKKTVILTLGLLLFAGAALAQYPIADATTNPPTQGQRVFPMIFNGTTWDRLRGDNGAVFARSDHPSRIRCTVAVSTATTLTAVGSSCVAPGAGLSIYITDILYSSSAAGIAADAFPTLKYGTGGTCGTGTTVFWGALSAAAIVATDNRTIPIKIPANNEVCWITSTAGSKFIVLGGFIAP